MSRMPETSCSAAMTRFFSSNSQKFPRRSRASSSATATISGWGNSQASRRASPASWPGIATTSFSTASPTSPHRRLGCSPPTAASGLMPHCGGRGKTTNVGLRPSGGSLRAKVRHDGQPWAMPCGLGLWNRMTGDYSASADSSRCRPTSPGSWPVIVARSFSAVFSR